jgi:hypothetical protein
LQRLRGDGFLTKLLDKPLYGKGSLLAGKGKRASGEKDVANNTVAILMEEYPRFLFPAASKR